MEIHWRHREKGPVVAAVIALVVLGLGSIFLTWQSIKRQRAVVENHMVLSSQVIIRGVEANLMRIMRSLRGNPSMMSMFPELSHELFTELTASGEVAFVGIYDEAGRMLIGSVEDTEKPLGLPPVALASLKSQGIWSGMTLFDGAQTMVVALYARPTMVRLFTSGMGLGLEPPPGTPPGPPPEPPQGMGMGQGMGQGGGHGMGSGSGMGQGMGQGEEPPPEAPMILVSGLSAERHLIQFDQYRRAAMFQTGYVFLAAILLWFLSFAYQRRRDQGRRLGRLERFQSKLLDTMPDGLITLGPDGVILAANGSALELLCPLNGYVEPGDEGVPDVSGAGLVGRHWSELPFPDLEPGAWQHVEHQGRRLEIMAVSFLDTGLFARDRDTGDEVFEDRLVLVRDRTKLRSLEEDLEEARRLATVGSLAAGVAHEVRNPLSSLRGFAQFFADKFKGREPFAAYATTMVQEADRLNRVVTDLLFLARPRAYAPDEVELAPLMNSLRGLLKFDLENKGVDLKAELTVPTVHADPDALRQVILNLLANSLDAVPDQGGEVRLLSTRGQGGVWLAVEDNGPGMPEEVKTQAFEPFFTAKQGGTGLGLAIVQTIVRGHRGAVRIDTEPGRGTAVRLFFPDSGPHPDADYLQNGKGRPRQREHEPEHEEGDA